MLLEKEEFLAIKREIVADILDRLRNLARLEAELLFRAYANYPGSLPHFSERISLAIIKVMRFCRALYDRADSFNLSCYRVVHYYFLISFN
jgi:glutamate dehydrogenase